MKHIEAKAYQDFLRSFYKGEHGTKRLGQAFYDEFRLDKITDQESLQNLYEYDGDQALNIIRSIFDFM